MSERIDFTNCLRVPGKAYNGANGKKICIEYADKLYMLKFPPSGKDKRTALSYTNSCLSEHIASSIFNMLGVDAQKTMLGTFSIEGKEKVVCACQDFTANGEQLFDFCSIKNTVLDSETNGTGTELDDILDTIEKQTLMDFQAQAYPDARRKTRGACQLHRGGQSRSPVRPLCNRKQLSYLLPQSKISRILYAI